MGLLAGIVKKKGSRKSSGAWKTVGANQSEVKKDFQKDEKLLTEETDTTEKDKDIEEEITLLRGKKSGHKRTTPQNLRLKVWRIPGQSLIVISVIINWNHKAYYMHT